MASESARGRRALRASGPPAAITAGLAVASTAIAGARVEAMTDPVATTAARTLGLDPSLGPAILFGVAVFVLLVAFVVPGLFEGSA